MINEWNNTNSQRLNFILREMKDTERRWLIVSPCWPDKTGTGWPIGYISEGPSCRRGRPAQWPQDSALHQRSRTGPGAEGPSSAQKHKETEGSHFQNRYSCLWETMWWWVMSLNDTGVFCPLISEYLLLFWLLEFEHLIILTKQNDYLYVLTYPVGLSSRHTVKASWETDNQTS